ncbi:hypothetical protein HOC01_04755 [archaeon]|jgi:hypothetical protein|nr:hypothetical protein [archaeon]MBT6698277.1 hypothetical protein [archaeon]
MSIENNNEIAYLVHFSEDGVRLEPGSDGLHGTVVIARSHEEAIGRALLSNNYIELIENGYGPSREEICGDFERRYVHVQKLHLDSGPKGLELRIVQAELEGQGKK